MDEELQLKILTYYYEKWKEDIRHIPRLFDIKDDRGAEIDGKILEANADYLVDKGFLVRPMTSGYCTKITILGVNKIESRRIIPDKKIRRQILEYLKETYNENPNRRSEKNELVKIFNLTDVIIERNVWFLDEMGYVDTLWFGGGFAVKISSDGLDFLNQPTELENEKRVMAHAYSLLYELENELRQSYEMILRREYDDAWWEEGVSSKIRDKAKDSKEKGNGDYSLIYFTDFEDLKLIPNKKWDLFKDVFKTQNKILARLGELEPIRHKIAHSRLLTNDEITKLELFHKEILKMLKAARGSNTRSR